MGIIWLLPFFLVRFGLLSLLNKKAVGRAAHFAPLQGKETAAYWIYQISNTAILIVICFIKIKTTPAWLFFAGLSVYSAGLAMLTVSIVNFAFPSENGINQKGIYRLSRNPMYVAYFLFFMGCAGLAQSPLLFTLVLIFQISAHWIILAEERWCSQKFGQAYLQYMKSVRRYL